MTHPHDDDLLQFVLQTLEESDHAEIRQHLSQCEQCRVRERKLQEEIERLGRVEIQMDMPRAPRLPTVPFVYARRWGWAAGLAAGFLLGFLTAHLAEDTRPVAVPQRLITTAASSSSSGYVSCQAMDVRTVFSP
jgi:anti-sigma factor RsiW